MATNTNRIQALMAAELEKNFRNTFYVFVTSSHSPMLNINLYLQILPQLWWGFQVQRLQIFVVLLFYLTVVNYKVGEVNNIHLCLPCSSTPYTWSKTTSNLFFYLSHSSIFWTHWWVVYKMCLQYMWNRKAGCVQLCYTLPHLLVIGLFHVMSENIQLGILYCCYLKNINIWSVISFCHGTQTFASCVKKKTN